jgi:hypothetical protein
MGAEVAAEVAAAEGKSRSQHYLSNRANQSPIIMKVSAGPFLALPFLYFK